MTATIAPSMIGTTALYLADADPQSAADIRERVAAFARDFPKVAHSLTSVGVELANFDDFPQAYAETQDQGRGLSRIVLNPTVYGRGTREHLETLAQGDLLYGWHAWPGSKFIIDHELGHVLDVYLGRGNHTQQPALRLDYWDAPSIGGRYAEQSPFEAFAEAFANYRAGVKIGNANVERVLFDALDAAR